MLRVSLSLFLIFAIVSAPLAGRAADQAPGPVATLALALRLYTRAEAGGDALGMAVAARLAGTIRQREARHWPKESGKAPGPVLRDVILQDEAGSDAARPWVTPELLTSGAAWSGALLMAEENEALSDLLYELPPPVIQGGVSRVTEALAAGRQDRWSLPFAGQSPAEIAVFLAEDRPDSDTAAPPFLLWSVLDGAGGILCPERRVALDICSFTPGENGFYQVIISNRSGREGRYLLLAN